ncbi:Neutral ceramidase [Thalassocella blandensis]|nr:Neutral ceramidase [Thalassocella blandensis]
MLNNRTLCVVSGFLLFLSCEYAFAQSAFKVGAAKVDITGPITAASTGYNSPGDELSGLGMRLFSRAFVISQNTVDASGQERLVALVTAEQLHLYQSVKLGVVKQLRARGYGEVFNEKNILLSATHTHASGSNISWYTLFNLFNGVVGFDRLHYQVVVNGISASIIEAYHQRQDATIRYAQGAVIEGSYNRSSLAYQQNHDADQFMEDTDNRMRLLRFDTLQGTPIGIINWHGVHTTSLSIHNTRTHSDNKGWAAYQFEKMMGGNFVAAFAQGANGDASPNFPNPEDITLPFLRPSDLDPLLDVMQDPMLAGEKQLDVALTLFQNAQPINSAALDYRHTYIDFNRVQLKSIPSYKMPWDTELFHKTCVGVVGAGFLAGVEEGGAIDYAAEGQVKNHYTFGNGHWQLQKFDLAEVDSQLFDILNGVWPLVTHVLRTQKYDACHKEKFALLPVGDVDDFWLFNRDVPFVPTVLPLQIIRLGDLYFAATPFEMTAMTWRRIEKRLMQELPENYHIIPAGMSNAYGMYLTTREEYAAQHFEGAFNSFGPWSQEIVAQELAVLARDVIMQRPSPSGPKPKDLSSQQYIETPISAHGVVNDAGNYGQVLQDVKAKYFAHHDKVEVRFQAAHPRTVLELRQTRMEIDGLDLVDYSFFSIEKLVNTTNASTDQRWEVVARDDDPYTTLDWERDGGKGSLSAYSSVTISWILRDQMAGTYRVRYQGVAKEFSLFGPNYKVFSGLSSEFILQDQPL